MANQAPNSFYFECLQGNIDLTTGVWKMALFPSTWSELNIDSDSVWGDISGGEVTGTNYAAGGGAITLTVTQDNTDNRAEVTGTDVTFTNVTIADYRWAVIYQESGGSAQHIFRTVDYGSAKSITAQDLTLTMPNQVFQLGSA